MTEFISLFQAAIVFGTIIIYGAIGEILTEKSGNLNLGVPGVMYLGGIAGLTGVFFYEHSVAVPSVFLCILIAILCAFAAAMFGGLIFSFLTITLRTNQNVTGLTLTIFSGGCGKLLRRLADEARRRRRTNLRCDDKRCIPCNATMDGWLGHHRQTLPQLPASWSISRLRWRCSSAGSSTRPASASTFARSAKIRRRRMRRESMSRSISTSRPASEPVSPDLAACITSWDYTKGTWANDGAIEALGWLAVALVIFATWKPKRAIWGAYLFGALYWLYFYIPGLNRSSQEIFKMLPYLATLFVLIMVALRKKREDQPPHSLGAAYFREER